MAQARLPGHKIEGSTHAQGCESGELVPESDCRQILCPRSPTYLILVLAPLLQTKFCVRCQRSEDKLDMISDSSKLPTWEVHER